MNKKGFQILASGEEATVYVYGGINVEDQNGYFVSSEEFVDAVNAIEAGQITVRIASVGGDPVGAAAMYQALVDHRAKVTTVVDSRAYSAGSMLLQAGDRRVARPLAMIMLHGPSAPRNGTQRDHLETAAALGAHTEMMVQAYARHGIPEDDIRGWLTGEQDVYFSAKEALAAKLIDEIAESAQLAAILSDDYRVAAMGDTPTPAVESRATKEADMADEDLGGQTGAPTDNKEAILAAEQKASAAVKRAETTRRRQIRGVFEAFHDGDPASPITALYDECLDDMDCTEDQARAKILAALATSRPVIAKEQYGITSSPAKPPNASHHLGGSVSAGADQTDKIRAGVSAALLVRAGLATPEIRATVDGSNPWRGSRLIEIAAQSCERAGVNTRGMMPMEIVAAAFTQSTSDFPVLLEDAMHKSMLNAYRMAADTWSRFCATGSVSDFRPHHRYRSASIGNYQKVNESGEFVNVAIPDGEKASVSVDTQGLIVNMSRKMVVNDDLGAFLGMAAQIGRSGRRTVEAAVYALLGENSGLGPTQADGQPLFHSNRANVDATGAVNSVARWDAMRVIMAQQKDVGGNDYLDLRPAVWVGPVGLGGLARQVNEAEYDDESQKNQRRPNISRGLVRDIVDTPRLSGTRYYLFADPSEAPVIEVSFLDGQQEPVLERMDGFDVDGTRYKGRLDFGVSDVDFRGGVTNAGG